MLTQEEIVKELEITKTLIEIEGHSSNSINRWWQAGYKTALLVILEQLKSEQIKRLKNSGIDFKRIVEILESEEKW